MLPSFLGHVPVEEEREPKQSTSNKTSRAHGPRAAPLALSRGIIRASWEQLCFLMPTVCSQQQKKESPQQASSPLSNLSKLQRASSGAIAHRSSNPTTEFTLKNMQQNPISTQQLFPNAGIHLSEEHVVDWSSVGRDANC